MTTLHVIPLNDIIEHSDDEDCVCGPTTNFVNLPEGASGWVVVHHSLDHRERTEIRETIPIEHNPI